MISKNQTKSRPKAEEFSDPESFGLFMEALRDLQFYAEYSASGEPDTAKLDQNLDQARESLEKCCRDFPDDLLPAYYLAITLTMQNQRLYAQEVATVSPQADPKSALLVERPWPLLDRAANLFEKVMKCSDHELSEAAKFNVAHVLAKREHQGDLERARELLTSLPTRPFFSEVPSFLSRLRERLRGTRTSREEARYRNYQEGVALLFQSRTLRCAIEARSAFKSKKDPEFKKANDELLGARAEIEKSESLSPDQKQDLLADSWTKSGFLAYIQAVKEVPPRDRDLQEAERCLKQALRCKPYWIPAQTYLAMVQKAQGREKDASEALKSVLGKAAAEVAASATTPNAHDREGNEDREDRTV